MLKQKFIDEYFKSKSSRHALNNTKNNSDVTVTSCSENGKKRKKLKLPKDTIKHLKSNKSFSDDVKDEKIEFQRTNISNYEEAQRDIKEHIEQNISLSQSSISNISSAGSEECTIVYENINELSQEDHNDARLLVEDNDIVNDSINPAFTENDIDMSSVNKPREDMLNNGTHLRRADEEMEYNNEFLEKTPTKKEAAFNKSTSPKADSSSSSPRLKKSRYSPKMSSGKSPKKQVTEKLFDQFVNIDIARTVIEHMNLAKQGAISLNNFNLEEIYSMDKFNYAYGEISTETSVNYQLNNVNLPTDINAKVLIGSILTVLSKPFNCGYFEEKELDFLYSILTLPEKGQMLLARMIKRIRVWHRIHAINYPYISKDLRDVFNLLESQFICTSNIKNEHLSVLLELLQSNELRLLCQNMKINNKGTKDVIVAKLTELSKQKALYPGMRSPSSALYDCIFSMLGYCVRITDKMWNIIDVIMTLLLPNEDPQSTMSDIFLKLREIYLGNIELPNIPGNQFPIFSSKAQLIAYVHVKSLLSKTLQLMLKKNWEEAQTYGKLAMETLPNLLEIEFLRLKNSKLPLHVRKFMPGYVWLKILSKSIDAFKRKKDITEVEKILNFLIEQNCHMQTYKGKWYCELAIIKMHHQKDADSGALVTIKALNCENLSQVDKIDLLQRAKMIFNRKTNVNPETKMHISQVLNDYYSQMPMFDKKIVIYSSMMPKSHRSGKSNWHIKSSDEGDGYGSVELVALYHYKEEQNFPNGLHCEGSLPILLFATLFWEELFEKQIPGAFVTPYGIAPADLFTTHFYKHRKKEIDIKLQIIDSFNADPASFSTWMEARFGMYRKYNSLMPSNLLEHNIYMKEIVYCLGVPGVTGICKRLLEDFKLWSAGFPDLILWNYDTKQHKIVEVKGPGDALSTKQQLWLQYLNELGLNAEVCLIQGRQMTCVNYRFKAPKASVNIRKPEET